MFNICLDMFEENICFIYRCGRQMFNICLDIFEEQK